MGECCQQVQSYEGELLLISAGLNPILGRAKTYVMSDIHITLLLHGCLLFSEPDIVDPENIPRGGGPS